MRFVDAQPFSSLQEDFRVNVKAMIDSVVKDVQPKKIKDACGVNRSQMKTTGPELLHYMSALLEQLNTNSSFCLEDAWTNVSRKVTMDAFNKATAAFSEGTENIFHSAKLPMETSAFVHAASALSADVMKEYITTAIQRDSVEFGADALQLHLTEIEKTCSDKNALASDKKIESLIDAWVTELLRKLETSNTDLADNAAYEVYKAQLLGQCQAHKDKVGPSWLKMESALLHRMQETDRVAAMRFELSAQDVELKAKAAEAIAEQAQRIKAERELEAQKLNMQQQEKRSEQAKIELLAQFEKDRAEQQEVMDARLKTLQQEHANAIKRGELKLAEQMADAQNNLNRTIRAMEQKQSQDLDDMKSEHQRSLTAMQESQKSLQGEIDKVRAEATEAARKHEEDMRNQPAATTQQVVYFWWPYGYGY